MKRTFATTNRVLRQISHDRRTLALIIVVPPLLITLFKYVFNSNEAVFDGLAPLLLGIFPLIMMFLITSIGTLRERRSGTLERLMTTPMSKFNFILGYAFAFSIVAIIQAVITTLVMIYLLGVDISGGTWPTLMAATLSALLGTALGLLASAFARTEFQAIQFMPAFIFPQLLVCGLFIARDQMADWLQWFANIMPLTYSADLMKQISTTTSWTSDYTKDVIVVASFIIGVLLLSAITIRRRERN